MPTKAELEKRLEVGLKKYKALRKKHNALVERYNKLIKTLKR